jgi:superfamily II DNA or RNA helicase
MNYNQFLNKKNIYHQSLGIDLPIEQIDKSLFDWQKAIVKWAVGKGRCALFADCGLGKTLMQLEWARQIGGDSIILAPLAVSEQTSREGDKFGYKVNVAASQEDIRPGINVTNYEKLHKFDPAYFKSVVLDESSILKNYSGKIRNQIIDSFHRTPFKLCCTATPSPNDYTEMGNHAEFLNIMSRTEMLAMFFINDTKDTGKWRLKGHVKANSFWAWLSSWAIMLRSPDDIGYDGKDFLLPDINIQDVIIPYSGKITELFVENATTLSERRTARKESMDDRVMQASELVNQSDEQWLVWCNLNEESSKLTTAIKGSVEIAGRHDHNHKKTAMLDFADAKIKALVTKPSLAGFGMNWQNCHNMIFVGLSDSYEQLYQAIRRCWRFGQKETVNVYIVIGEKEGAVSKNIKRKESDLSVMYKGMIEHTKKFSTIDIQATTKTFTEYKPTIEMNLPMFMREGI